MPDIKIIKMRFLWMCHLVKLGYKEKTVRSPSYWSFHSSESDQINQEKW